MSKTYKDRKSRNEFKKIRGDKRVSSKPKGENKDKKKNNTWDSFGV